MDWLGSWGEHLHVFALAVALAACAGLRAWLPLLLTGGLARLGYLDLGESFSFLASDKAMIVLSVATLLEIAADKMPAIDNALDALSTVARPAAGALLAASVFGTLTDPFTSLALGVAVGAPSALAPHAIKSLARAASTTFTGGLANPVISVVEDGVTLLMFAVAVLVPFVVAGALALTLLLLWRRSRRRAALEGGTA